MNNSFINLQHQKYQNDTNLNQKVIINNLTGKYFFQKTDPELWLNLTKLNLAHNKIKIQLNENTKPLPSLQQLNLQNCKLSNQSFRNLLKLNLISNLRRLNLENNQLSGDVIKNLSKYKLYNLLELNFNRNFLNDNSIKYLSNIRCNSFYIICLQNNPITNVSLLNIQKAWNAIIELTGMNYRLLYSLPERSRIMVRNRNGY